MSFKLSSFKNKIYHDLRDLFINPIDDSNIQKIFNKHLEDYPNKQFVLLNDFKTNLEIPKSTLLYFKLSLIKKGENGYTYEYFNLKYNDSIIINIIHHNENKYEFLVTYILSDLKIRNANITTLCKEVLHQKENHYHFHFQDTNIDIFREKRLYIKETFYIILFALLIVVLIFIGCI